MEIEFVLKVIHTKEWEMLGWVSVGLPGVRVCGERAQDPVVGKKGCEETRGLHFANQACDLGVILCSVNPDV